MLIGVLINLFCAYCCGKWAIGAFTARANAFGWVCLVGSSYNVALVLKFLSDVTA